jgi:enamine deaminase RidA (YjgF/YER057c/UK114 family)
MTKDWGNGITFHRRDMKFRDGQAVYITVLAGKAIRSNTTIRNAFSNLYEHLRRNKIQILLEKVYGLRTLREDVSSIRNHAIKPLIKDVDVPFTYIGCTPCIGGKLAGIQIIGFVRSKTASVDTILLGEKPVGRILDTGSFRGIYLSGLTGSAGQGPSIAKQSESIVDQCAEIFGRYGMTAKNIVRTWIYFPRLLRWYKRFLKVRARIFREFGLISESKHYLPASTGIQGGGRPHEEIFIDLIGFAPKSKTIGSVSPMRSRRQDEAAKYGATFSRGMAIEMKGASLLHISGTASINPKGETVYLRDEQGQITETLIDIGALLESRNAG